MLVEIITQNSIFRIRNNKISNLFKFKHRINHLSCLIVQVDMPIKIRKVKKITL